MLNNIKKWILKKHTFLTHLLLTIFTYGLWIIVYFYFKYSHNIKTTNMDSTDNNYTFENTHWDDSYYKKFTQLQKEYNLILTKHYNNIEKIGVLYTVANNLSLPNSTQMQEVINLCLADIQIAPLFKEYCLKEKELRNDINKHLPNYVSFQRLSIIYEKQKDYENAMLVCKQAIDLGFVDDGTTGQMIGRLARLIKKNNTQKKQIQERNKKAENV